MSDAKQRLLKANNVQRRRFEKDADRLIKQAKSNNDEEVRDAKTRIENALVEDVMGPQLAELLLIRSQIQQAKRTIAALGQDADKIRLELGERGLTISTSPWGDFGMKFYTDPPVTDEPDDPDVCKKDLGNENVQFTILSCKQNPLVSKLEGLTASLTDQTWELDEDEITLRQKIWAVISTDEIVDALNTFRAKWVE